MDGFFDLMIIAFVLYAVFRGVAGRARQRPPPSQEEGREIDWEGRIGDVFEGLGLPRPEPRRPPAEIKAPAREPESADEHSWVVQDVTAGQERAGRAEPAAQPLPAPAAQRIPAELARERAEREARRRKLLEIAGLAEVAAREAKPPASPPPTVRPPAVRPATTLGSPWAPADAPGSTVSRPRVRSTHSAEAAAAGLPALDHLSELQRAILYSEILGRPKALEE